MPRALRIHVPGASLHVIQRRNNRTVIFHEDDDYEVFLTMLQSVAGRNGVSVHGYVLMTTHTHLLVTPSDAKALPKTMQQLGVRYVMYFNRKYERVGTLWTGRYRALLVGKERYWLTCLRYIEQNPVRAGMVSAPQDYRWSSYAVHGAGHPSDWLATHHVYDGLGANPQQRCAAYRAICATPITDAQLVGQRLGLKGQTRVRPGSDPSLNP